MRKVGYPEGLARFSLVTYDPGDFVVHLGSMYEAIATNTGKLPNESPADWRALPPFHLLQTTCALRRIRAMPASGSVGLSADFADDTLRSSPGT